MAIKVDAAAIVGPTCLGYSLKLSTLLLVSSGVEQNDWTINCAMRTLESTMCEMLRTRCQAVDVAQGYPNTCWRYTTRTWSHVNRARCILHILMSPRNDGLLRALAPGPSFE